VQDGTLMKKKKKISSYIRKFRRDRLQSHLYEEVLPNMEMRKHLTIYEEAVGHTVCDFATAPSEFSFILGKFYFLFYLCRRAD
jgi:hypothetical protein